MALRTQVIPLVLDAGVNNKIDEKVLPLGEFKRLENVRRTKTGLFQKRFGSVSLPTGITGGGNLTSTQGAATFGNELLQFQENQAYSFSEGSNSWLPKGDVSLSQAAITTILRNSEQQAAADAASNVFNGLRIAAFEDSSGGVRGKVFDGNSDTVLVANQLLNASGSRPKTLAVGEYLYAFYVVANSLRVRRYNKNVGTTFDTEVSLAADVNASGFYDVQVYGVYMVVTWHTLGNQIKLAYVTQAPALGTPVLGFPATATLPFAVTDSLAIWSQFDSGLIYLAWFDAAVGLRATARKAVDLTQQFAPVTVDSTLSPVVRNVCGISTSATASRLFYEVNGQKVNTNTLSSTGVIGSNILVRRGVGIVSKPWICHEQAFFLASWDSTLQATYFAIRSDGFIVSKLLYGQGGGNSLRQGYVPEATEVAVETFLIGALKKNKIITENNTTFTRKGVVGIEIDCSASQKPQVFSLGENLHLLGGILQSYDSIGFTETGFHIFPEGITNPSNATIGGNLTDGVRQYVIVYEWMDGRGQLHRSAPSVPIIVTLAGGTSTQTTTLAIPTLRLTAKIGARVQPVLAVYRNVNGGTIFYRVSSQTTAGGQNGLFFSDYTVDSVSFVDGLADSAITSREILYTTGGILENIAPDPSSAGTVFKNRLIINSTDGSGLSYYSKQVVPGEGLAFSPYLAISADPENKQVPSMGVLDDKLILFKNDTAYATYGDGLNDAGQGVDFAIPEKIATSTGCPYPDSIVGTQYGLFYKSLRGIRLLERNLIENPVGDAVDDFNYLTISAAFSMPDQEEIRFTSAEGITLVFSDAFKVWTYFTGQEAFDALLWKGQYVRFTAEAVAKKEVIGQYHDDGAFYSMLIETGWISFAGLQAFQRVWRLLLLGEYKSRHKLLFKIAKDFEPAWVEMFYWDPQAAVNQQTYGESTPYGSESPYGDGDADDVVTDSVYQVRAHLATQKCESIKFSINDVNIGTAGESFSLTAMSFEVGLKKGAFKASQVKGAGSLG